MTLSRIPEQVDILAVGVHPDDVELSCSGTLLKHQELGYSIGLLDLTKGELGTRGDAETRSREAYLAGEKLGVRFRVQLDLKDGFFNWNEESLLQIIQVIRGARPKMLFANALSDRHPDHGRSAKLVADAAFYSGLQKIKTLDHEGRPQERWRPQRILHYIQDHQLEADIIVDISPFMEQKIELIRIFKSQFYDPGSAELDSPISGRDFFDYIKSKSRVYGRYMGVEFAEAFQHNGPLPLEDLIKGLS
ncbi:MAG TPA: bacillithiol biosynthesis deacetylase BshB1 [Saprospiraceae bacterium]|nr:bacillithiol biosynthesis deacetylase BshB1 [Saprospiraceae bacterium]